MGTIHYPLTEQIADTIAVHGLAWTLRYYAKRIPAAQLRVLMVGAYCYQA
jgi:hypothetical protein